MTQWKKSLREAAWIMLVTLVLSFGAYAVRPERLPLIASEETMAAADEEGALFQPISLQAAVSYFESGAALFTDARPYKAYASGHIRGATHLDPNEFDDWSERFFSRYPVDQVIITYCEGSQCQLSYHLAEKLTWLGYEKVYYLKDGWGRWKTNNLPTE